ncbi:hypothetical protein DRJ48_01745 [Candidatus Woesearchaeota archaeon]|nr:MAG: hypothetical protein DRJ48_01745 [Candidatus Woesearchaeota archaeon]
MDKRELEVVLALVFIIFLISFGFGVYYGVEMLTSKVTTVLTVVERQPANCSFNLSAGWNLIGLSCEPRDPAPATLVNESGNNIISIHKYEPDSSDKWKVYNPNLPWWVVQDLTKLSRADGYWVRAKEDGFVDFNGSLTVPTYIQLVRGWNLVGYPHIETRNISVALASISGKYTIVYSYNESSAEWLVYRPDSDWGIQELKWLKQSDGLWVNMSDEGVWKIES